MRRGGLPAALAALLAIPTGAAAQSPDACNDPSDPAHATYDCKVSRLRERSFVVVAFVDTGINPYHVDFRLPAGDDLQDVPPWEYIDGYPTTARALNLSLDASTYGEAITRDDRVWKTAKWNTLYWIPGTKIVGAHAVAGSAFADPTPVLDDNSHGTAVASVAAGMVHGSAPDTDVLIVSVEGIGAEPFEWATRQPWIDIVSNSWGYTGNLYFNTADHRDSKAAVDAGKVIAFAAGNGASNTRITCDRVLTTTSSTAGPSWVLTVGAASPKNGQNYCWQSVPPDVSSWGDHWPAAANQSIESERTFGGTSNATPLIAGVIAGQVLAARRALGDRVEGPHGPAALAVAAAGAELPASGPLADGVLTGAEVEATTMRTAYPQDFDPARCRADPMDCAKTTPTTPAYYTYLGYGIVDGESRDRAMRVLFGIDPMPDRSDVDRWMLVKDTASDAVWSTLAL